jgi:hypothetical protein
MTIIVATYRIDGAPCVIAGAGGTPDGACTVLPPGAGSGTALRGCGDGAAGVAGANPAPDEPGAIEAGFGDWALPGEGAKTVTAQASVANRATRIMVGSSKVGGLRTCMC